MKRKDIEKAAKRTIDEYNLNPEYGSYFEHGFIDGADWRINSVWHKELEKSETRKCIMVRFTNGLFDLFEDVRELKGIEDRVESFAYIEDLLPTKED